MPGLQVNPQLYTQAWECSKLTLEIILESAHDGHVYEISRLMDFTEVIPILLKFGISRQGLSLKHQHMFVHSITGTFLMGKRSKNSPVYRAFVENPLYDNNLIRLMFEMANIPARGYRLGYRKATTN